MYKQKTCEVNKFPDKALWDKNPPKMPLNWFGVDYLLLGWGLPLSVVCIATETFPLWVVLRFASSGKLEIVSGLGMGLVSTPPIITGTPFGLDLCRLGAFCLSFCTFLCVSVLLCLEVFVSLVSSNPALTIFLPHLPQRTLTLKTFGTECSEVSHSAHCPVAGLCICYHLLIMAEQGTDWSECGRMVLEVILLLCSFSTQ